jgi:hypothetical protein
MKHVVGNIKWGKELCPIELRPVEREIILPPPY